MQPATFLRCTTNGFFTPLGNYFLWFTLDSFFNSFFSPFFTIQSIQFIHVQMNILIFPNGFSMRVGMSENNDDDNTTLCIFSTWAKIILKWRRSSTWKRVDQCLLQRIFFAFISLANGFFFCAQNWTKRKFCVWYVWGKYFVQKLALNFIHLEKKLLSTSKLSLNILGHGKLCNFYFEIWHLNLNQWSFQFLTPQNAPSTPLNFVILCHRGKLLLFSHVTGNNNGNFTD